MPEPPGLLKIYQPRMRYYLVDEGRYSDEQIAGATGLALEDVAKLRTEG